MIHTDENVDRSDRPTPISEESKPIQTVNKNAYEIRESILEKSIDVVKLSNGIVLGDIKLTTEKILEVASKFYEFVENKNRHNR